MSSAHEPNPYGYAGEGTAPDTRLEDLLEDTAESISVPVDDLTEPMAEDADGTDGAQ
ncbi:hypothetical protein [Phytohabitans suffuscus]|uniref:Uncharacterized protein n=1 Tax=Phytohabitans suffuscus TaxID=624315 RepID=A0A6F8YWV2_9ACTN|nr:hypothetical protein [Phytohabitans suffuscus]BCB90536.1 hypothetical protein Psuf_078490 [Phytohabitans suffuscus]